MRPRFGLSLACAVLLAAYCVTSITAQTAPSAASTKPNFTGTWKMNPQKSKLSGRGPESIIIKLDHRDNYLTEALTVSGGGDERTIEAKYTTDGKESVVQIEDDVVKATVKWEGNALVIVWKGPEGRLFGRNLTLAAGGKTMTINMKQNRPDGSEVEDTLVFEKQ